MDCKTLEDKVRQVIAIDPTAATNDFSLVRGVWRTFYGHLFRPHPDNEVCVSILEIHKLPSREKILAARRRAFPPAKPPPAPAPEPETPWYSRDHGD